VVSCELYVLLL